METVDADPRYHVLGDEPLVITQPCRPITGTVVDSKTGGPIEGVKIYCQRMGIPSAVYGSGAAPLTHTDAEGKFELLGMPKSTGNRLMIYPPADQPYLIQEVNRIPETVGMQPADLNIKLEQGVWISGNVIDKHTGQGVKAGLRYFPMADNPHYQAAKGFQTSSRNDHYTFFDNYQTGADGNFRVVGLPGKAVLGATVDNQNYRPGVGYKQIFELWSQGYSQQRIKQYAEIGIDLSEKKFLNLSNDYVFRNSYGSSFIAIEPSESGITIDRPIELDPGKDVELKVVDPDGNPVEQFTMSKHNGFWGEKEFAQGMATLTRMGDDEIRGVRIESKTKPLAAVVKISGDPRNLDDKTITLHPYAKLSGRLQDKQGKPLTGYLVSQQNTEATTNDQGEFLLEKLTIGYSHLGLRITRPRVNPDEIRPRELGEFTEVDITKSLQPGRILELGDVEIDPTDYWMIASGID